ncbi:hypothetical protein QTI34_09800 [Clostridium perfringens]|uniref:PglD-related sugar-binding protein n=1 Tax=Clostridium perfringens TaxID=1502 RepID=UPI0003F4D993|nr:hypothetical protein [Clostridium perfringens]MDM0800777.1 hypothetical protein [Clostridium perfringens]
MKEFNKRLIILGSGGYGRVVADIARQLDSYDRILFLDDKDIRNDVIGKCSDYRDFIDEYTEFYPAFGDNELRINWINTLVSEGAKVPKIIHPSAYISSLTTIGLGTVILPKAIINSYADIGIGCIINLGAIVDHNCSIGDGSHICPGTIIKADNNVTPCTKIEAGVVIQNGFYK